MCSNFCINIKSFSIKIIDIQFCNLKGNILYQFIDRKKRISINRKSFTVDQIAKNGLLMPSMKNSSIKMIVIHKLFLKRFAISLLIFKDEMEFRNRTQNNATRS